MRYEPSARNFSAAAIDFAVTDFADEADADVKSVNGLKLTSHLSAMDHEQALYECGPADAATAWHALSTVPPVDETTVFLAAATVTAVHECKFTPAPTSYVNCSPTIGHAMWNSDRPIRHADPPAPAPAVGTLQRPGQENADVARCPVLQPSKRFRPDVQRFAPTLREHADAGITESMAVDAAIIDPIPDAHADDVTIDGGVKSTSVTVFATGPIQTVSDTVRNSHRAAPCNLQSGFDMLATALLSRSVEA